MAEEAPAPRAPGPAVVLGLALAGLLAAPPLAQLGGIEVSRPLTPPLEPAPPPAWPGDLPSLLGLPRRVEAWLGERPGLRALLVRLRGLVRFIGLGVSGSPNVQVGAEQMLFYAVERRTGRVPAQGGLLGVDTRPFAAWAARRRARAEAVGAHVLIILFPEKSDVYPELLPEGEEPVEDRPARAILADLGRDLDLDVLDLTAPLRAARAWGQPFHRGDTHPSEDGYAAAATAVLAHLGKRLPGLGPASRDLPLRMPAAPAPDDLIGMLALDSILVEALRPEGRAFAGATRTVSFMDPSLEPRRDTPLEAVYQGPDRAAPVAQLVGDSFGYHLAPYLAPAFSRLRALRLRLDPTLPPMGDGERPAVVIYETVARSLEASRPDALLAPTEGLVPPRPAARVPSGLPGGVSARLRAGGRLADDGRGGLELEAAGPDPQLEIFAGTGNGTPRLRVRLSVQTPGPTTLELFAATRTLPYPALPTIRVRVPGPPTDVVLSLRPLPDLVSLRLDPGGMPGPYRLRDLALEELPAPPEAPLPPARAPFAAMALHPAMLLVLPAAPMGGALP